MNLGLLFNFAHLGYVVSYRGKMYRWFREEGRLIRCSYLAISWHDSGNQRYKFSIVL